MTNMGPGRLGAANQGIGLQSFKSGLKNLIFYSSVTIHVSSKMIFF